MSNIKEQTRLRRKARIRAKIRGTEKRPRLVVFRSLGNNYASLIDDDSNKVIATCSDLKDSGKETKTEKAKKVGIEIAKKASENKITEVVFDRNGYKYHGRIKALAEGAREGGIKF
jgi:large subunit ribosomal protein L18